MSTLDKAFIRAYHRPAAAKKAKGDGPHLPERPEASFAQAGTVPFSASESPAVPLSRALAGLSTPVEPVSPSIGALLDEALQADGAGSTGFSRNAVEEPRKRGTTNAVTRRYDPPATAKEVVAIAAAVHLPPPAQERHNWVGGGSRPAARGPAWSPLLQVDRVVWPAIHSRLQGTAQAAIAQMTDGLQAMAIRAARSSAWRDAPVAKASRRCFGGRPQAAGAGPQSGPRR